MKKMAAGILSFLALAGSGFIATTLLADRVDVPTRNTGKMLKQATFSIRNMTCATCPITVRRAMEGVPGVRQVTVDYETKAATVNFDPGQTDPDAIARASTEAGYPAQADSTSRS